MVGSPTTPLAVILTPVGLGGQDGAISIDLRELRYVRVDKASWHATIGAGSLLGDVDDLLSMNKMNRVFSHGVCPGVGLGGHATIVR